MATGGRNLRAKWAEISFEKKLGMFVAPVFVAVVSAVLILALTPDPEPPSSTPPAGPTPSPSPSPAPPFGSRRLHVVALGVTEAEAPTIDVTLRNTAEVVAVVTKARFRVLEFRLAGACLPEAYILPSHAYDLVLPDHDAKGKVVDVVTSQEIRPNRADRFSFRARVGDGEHVSTESYLYALDVLMFHDGQQTPVRGGRLVIADPFPGEHWFAIGTPSSALPEPGGFRRCVERNRASLRAVFAAGRGNASPELAALAARVESSDE